MDIKYIINEENLADNMIKNVFKDDNAKHAKRTMKGELWELVETGRVNVKKYGVTDRVMDCDLTEYCSHKLANNEEQTNDSKWVLVKIFSNGEKTWTIC